MTAKLAEKRRDQRVRTVLPVSLENARGILRDMSASGAFFWVSGAYALGQEISFSIELQKAEGRMIWTCRGDVVRTEPRGTAMGIAVRIVEEELELA